MSSNVKLVTLSCPTLDRTITEFPINTSHTYNNTLQRIRTALGGIAQAWPYTDNHEPISDFNSVVSNQRILIGTDYFDRPGDDRETVVVQEGGARTAWMALTPPQRLAYITALHTTSSHKPTTYLTLPASLVHSRISHALTLPHNPSITQIPSMTTHSLTCIQSAWAQSLDAFLGVQGFIMPAGAKGDWDVTFLPTLAVLADATVGQAYVVRELVIQAVKERKGGRGNMVVQTGDVLSVVEGLYERAGCEVREGSGVVIVGEDRYLGA